MPQRQQQERDVLLVGEQGAVARVDVADKGEGEEEGGSVAVCPRQLEESVDGDGVGIVRGRRGLAYAAQAAEDGRCGV